MPTATVINPPNRLTENQLHRFIADEVNAGGFGSYEIVLNKKTGRKAHALYLWVLENQSDYDGILNPSIDREGITTTISFTWSDQPTTPVMHAATRISDRRWGNIITTEQVS